MEDAYVQKILERGMKISGFNLGQYLQNDLGLNANERTKAQDFLLDQDLVVIDHYQVCKISPLGMKIIQEYGSWREYKEQRENRERRAKRKEINEYHISNFKRYSYWPFAILGGIGGVYALGKIFGWWN